MLLKHCLVLAVLADSFFVSCLPMQNPSWALISVDLYNTDNGVLNKGSAAGVPIVTAVRTDDHSKSAFGTICDEHFDDHAGELLCQHLGYKKLLSWGNVDGNGDYISKSELVTAGVSTVVNDPNCSAGSTSLMTCNPVLMDHVCDAGKSVWIECDKSSSTWTFTGYGALIKMDEGDTRPQIGGNEGLALTYVFNGQNHLNGFICDDGFNDRAADLTCQEMGFKSAESYGTHGEKAYVPDSVLQMMNLKVVIDYLKCEDTDLRVTDCSHRIMENNCGLSDSIWVKCRK